MSEQTAASPFHEGERELQARMGVRDKIEDIGQRFVRDHMPDEHREFYEQLPYIVIGSVDADGRPWASMMVGRKGFVQTPDEFTLKLASRRIHGDPLTGITAPGSPVGILGIQYDQRRRNRLTGRIASATDDALVIHIDQTFGNCPQYIQAREPELLPEIDAVGTEKAVKGLSELGERARGIIGSADHFFIATSYAENPKDVTQGADVSHRGGKPGFVRIEDERTLTFPDFTGNFHFNTLGNISKNPRAGLLFIDFATGGMLYLTCSAEIVWDGEEKRAFSGAERLVRFGIDEGFLVENAMPIRWKFVDYSSSLNQTGSWQETAERIAARRAENVYRTYRVIRVEPESEVISSFYLEPDDGEAVSCHKAGQFLPIEIDLSDHAEKVRRTYTISNAPNGRYYRLSIKREPAPSPELRPGVSSNYFHDLMTTGSTLRALSPRGQFVLEEASARPAVLLSAGVGITPMISMLEALTLNSRTCGSVRKIYFLHGARNGREQAFREHVRQIAEQVSCVTTHFAYSKPDGEDREGIDYDSNGRIDVDLLKQLLPFDDYDFYFCGPTAFMQSIYEGLKNLNVGDERIHYEFFGPGATLLREYPGQSDGLVGDLGDLEPVEVEFASSGKTATWDPTRGTLLDLAEAEGLRPAYSCRSGICATCETAVTGEVAYTEPPLAAPAAGRALICCGYPVRSDDQARLVLDL